MKKICFLILGIAFLILGIIGLALPIIPQIPFLVLGACLLIMSSKKIKDFVLNSSIWIFFLLFVNEFEFENDK